MTTLKGLAIASGLTVGPCFNLKKTSKVLQAQAPDVERARFEEACKVAQEQLREIYEKTLKDLGEENAAIFEIHSMLIEDDDYKEMVFDAINEGMEASEAVISAGNSCAAIFEASDDEYTRERAGDFRDISERIADILNGAVIEFPTCPSIIIASELTPGQTVGLPRDLILGFATEVGSINSHAGILARNFGIPAVANINIKDIENGTIAAIDGNKGELIVNPSGEVLETIKKQIEENAILLEKRKELIHLPSISKSGKKISICANIGNLDDISLVTNNGAEGVGLFRSEFLYLSRNDYPTEDELFEAYKTTAVALGEKQLIIRTLDIGADKQADYFNLEQEENPAMGVRAIRLCKKHPEIFNTQLRAILRATAFGNIGIMFPMIISKEELLWIKDCVKQAENELIQEGKAVGNYQIGIMIETPAAVIISDELAKEVDFFSIGTNDLSQYTLAIDRQNSNCDEFFNVHHPAILRSIERTVKNGHAEGCWVGICGELGADMDLSQWYLDIGLDEISVSPSKILELREKIRSLE